MKKFHLRATVGPTLIGEVPFYVEKDSDAKALAELMSYCAVLHWGHSLDVIEAKPVPGEGLASLIADSPVVVNNPE